MIEWIDRLLHPEAYIAYDRWVEQWRVRNERQKAIITEFEARIAEFERQIDEISNQDGRSS